MRILCVGDSMTGLEERPQPTDENLIGYPKWLAENHRHKVWQLVYHKVADCPYPLVRSVGMVGCIRKMYHPQVDFLVFQGGGDELDQHGEVYRILDEYIEVWRAFGPHVLFLAMPYEHKPVCSWEANSRRDFNTILNLMWPHNSLRYYGVIAENAQCLGEDGFHFNDLGNERMAALVNAKIEEITSKS